MSATDTERGHDSIADRLFNRSSIATHGIKYSIVSVTTVAEHIYIRNALTNRMIQTSDPRLGRCVKVIADNQGATSRQIYAKIHEANIMSEMAARGAVSELERIGIVRRELTHNDRGGAKKLVFLTCEVDQ